jgi:hypothetical protein
VALQRMVALLDQHGLARDTVTLVVDKGSAALANTLELEQAGSAGSPLCFALEPGTRGIAGARRRTVVGLE